MKRSWAIAKLVLLSLAKLYLILFLFLTIIVEHRRHYDKGFSPELEQQLDGPWSQLGYLTDRTWHTLIEIGREGAHEVEVGTSLLLATRNSLLLVLGVALVGYLALFSYTVLGLRQMKEKLGRKTKYLLYAFPVSLLAAELSRSTVPRWLGGDGSAQFHSLISQHVINGHNTEGVLVFLAMVLCLILVMALGDGFIGRVVNLSKYKIHEYRQAAFYHYDRTRGKGVVESVGRDLSLEYFRAILVILPLILSQEIVLEIVFDVYGIGLYILDAFVTVQEMSASLLTNDILNPLIGGLIVVTLIVTGLDLAQRLVDLWLDPRAAQSDVE